jgi:methyltransferase (TIGR00027 family)
MAQRRAEETRGADRLFSDPFAELFVQAAGCAAPPSWAGPGRMKDYFAVRTRFFDDQLLAAARSGCRQVVILAAGLDARAYRLEWPAGTRVFEVDLAPVMEFKSAVLADHGVKPTCMRQVVVADLRTDFRSELLLGGFKQESGLAWLAEGILMYLRQIEADRLIEVVSDLACAGSRFAAEHVRRHLHKTIGFSAAMFALARLGARWRSGIDNPRAVRLEDAGSRSRGPDSRFWPFSQGPCPRLADRSDQESSPRHCCGGSGRAGSTTTRVLIPPERPTKFNGVRLP